ncbi:MAG: hypothetical protein OXI01_23285 [Albidovulum sp.]|nr:hypothetical protein [Albidovulum sp.]
MPRCKRPPTTRGSEHWLRVAVNDASAFTNAKIKVALGWRTQKRNEWRSSIKKDEYSEYFDDAFLDRLGIRKLEVPLDEFWPAGGPRWDGLARTSSGKILLVEAKAFTEESVDFECKAGSVSRKMICRALEQAKHAFKSNERANWESLFYQYANRLAHLQFLVSRNQIDGYLMFMCFANAPDVPSPCTGEYRKGADRLWRKCLGLGRHPYSRRDSTVVIDVPEMCDSCLVDDLRLWICLIDSLHREKQVEHAVRRRAKGPEAYPTGEIPQGNPPSVANAIGHMLYMNKCWKDSSVSMRSEGSA